MARTAQLTDLADRRLRCRLGDQRLVRGRDRDELRKSSHQPPRRCHQIREDGLHARLRARRAPGISCTNFRGSRPTPLIERREAHTCLEHDLRREIVSASSGARPFKELRRFPSSMPGNPSHQDLLDGCGGRVRAWLCDNQIRESTPSSFAKPRRWCPWPESSYLTTREAAFAEELYARAISKF